MTQTARPTHITEILKTIDSDYPTDIGASLAAYISALEAGQGMLPRGKSGTLRDPEWQYWHNVERVRQHRERALRKQHNNRP